MLKLGSHGSGLRVDKGRVRRDNVLADELVELHVSMKL